MIIIATITSISVMPLLRAPVMAPTGAGCARRGRLTGAAACRRRSGCCMLLADLLHLLGRELRPADRRPCTA